MKPPLSDNHRLLHQHHDDVAQLMASAEHPVFWVLDLDDPLAFEMAVKSGQTPQRLAAHRQCIHETAAGIPASNICTSIAVANTVLQSGWGIPPLAEGQRYLAVVSAGRVSVRAL